MLAVKETAMQLDAPIFNDEDKAREHLEAQRWPNGPVCPHCGATHEHATAIKGARARPSKAHPEGFERKGLYQCNACREQFTATVGTVFERSKIPLTKWLAATYLMSASKKGVSAHQLHRMLGVTYKTAWFMAHRIREAMGEKNEPLGGDGKTVEADETYFGQVESPRAERKDGKPFAADQADRGSRRGGHGSANKRAVIGLVERRGRVKTFRVDAANKETVGKIVRENVRKESRLHTDQSHLYKAVGKEMGAHETVNHGADEWVRGDVHTNSIESYWSVFKRGMKGIYQHCDEKHLHRYLAEFDFRHNRRAKLGFNDDMRAEAILRAIQGKRLTYRRIDAPAHA
jgi:transposase-like protein